MQLSKEEIVKIAKMSRIELVSDQQIDKFRKEVSAVLEYVDELKQVNTQGLEEVSQVTGLVNVQREDIVVDHANREEIFSQAPEMKDNYFKVKAIL